MVDRTGDDRRATGLVPAAGVPLLRLFAEKSGVRGHASTALLAPGFHPGRDRGQVLVDVAIGLAMGATSVSAAMDTTAGATAVTGAVASGVTAWRLFSDELDPVMLGRLARSRAAHRRRMWSLLAARPGGFPRVSVAGHVWDGWIVLDVDASLVESHSEKEGAAATYKKHVFGLHPILVTCANTGEILAILLRPGNAGSNTAEDHITVLTEAIAQLPARYRRKIIFRCDGAGATKDLLKWIKETAAKDGHTWHYSVGFDITQPIRDAIVKVPKKVWACAITPEGKVRDRAYVTELTGLLDLNRGQNGWPDGIRVIARLEPLHPKHRKNASEIEKRRGQRFQAVAHDLPGHHYPRQDAFHRDHADVESVIKEGKNLGLRRLPFYAMAANQAWCHAVMLAADLLAWLRLLILDHHPDLRTATPALLRRLLFQIPARLVRRARKRLIRLCADHPHTADLITAWNKIRALAAPS
ncbi:IS1380 family transposase [Microtetraspora malaysiensis]|uniref:IS1380 family transposase n=1 Tax=Microtetraspora malaysiensis TaxID=161358 RepID=A0ABW6T4V7_9ACTN